MSDYLSDDEQVARLQTWWRSYGTLTIMALVLGIALVLGWRWYQARQAEAVAAASVLYDEYNNAADSERTGVLNQLLGDYPNSTYSAFARMDQAQRAVEQGDVAAAVERYQALLAAGVDADIKDLANLRLARLLVQQEQLDAALSALGSIRGTGFRGPVAELKGDILFQQGDRAGANEAYVAALAALAPGEERPVLKMKENNTSTAEDGRFLPADAADTEVMTDDAAAVETQASNPSASEVDANVESAVDADADDTSN